MITEHRFPRGEAAAADLTARIAAILTGAIAQRGTASIALSGGRSPRPVLQSLAQADIDWGKVSVTLVDERWVAPDSADSNEKLVRDTLLQGRAAAARFIPLKTGDSDAASAQPVVESVLGTIAWPIDIVLLGMGDDGHTASLFPGAPQLDEGLTTRARTIAVTPPDAPHQRMSMTATAILDSRHVFLQIAGGAKIAIYDRARTDGPISELPIRIALHQDRVPVDIWIAET